MEEEEVEMGADLEDEEMKITEVAGLVAAEEVEAAMRGPGLEAGVVGEREVRAGLEGVTGEEDQGEGITKTPIVMETTTVLITVEWGEVMVVKEVGGEGEVEEVEEVEDQTEEVGVEDRTEAVRKTDRKGRAGGEMKVMIRRKGVLRITSSKTIQTVGTTPLPSWRTLTQLLRLRAIHHSRII